MAVASRWVFPGVVLGMYVPVALLFAKEVPEAYMDEIFHIPQCQAFCEGRLSYWDPMITTFPGLYYTALLFLSILFPGARGLKVLQGEAPGRAFRSLCSTPVLRFVNVVLSVVCLLLFREIAVEVRLRSGRLLASVENTKQKQAREEERDQNGAGIILETAAPTKQRRHSGKLEKRHQNGVGSFEGAMPEKRKQSVKSFRERDQSRAGEIETDVRTLSDAKRRGPKHVPLVRKHSIDGVPSDLATDAGTNWDRVRRELRGPRLEDDLKAVALVLYPPHFFFAFLFYTDVGSTAAVAAMYLAALRHKFRLAALLAIVAILFRQTNVVWALFVTCTGATEMLWPLPGSDPPAGESEEASNKVEPVSPAALWSLAKRAWTRRTAVLLTFGPLLSVIAAFVAFAVRNGGIVLGAKDAHQMSLHLPQFLYCLAFIFGALAPVQLLPAHVADVCSDVIGRVRRSPGRTLALFGLTLLAALSAVHWFTLEHPYLLADNRHYPFYLWRWVFKRHVAVKYWLVPLYLYAATSVVLSLARTQRPFWIFFYLVATFGVLVPAPLIEFRYFNIPFFLAALHVPMPLKRRRPTLLLQILLFAAVDIGAVFLFLRRTFRWPLQDGTQRFMW